MLCLRCGTLNNLNELRCRTCYSLLSGSAAAERPVRSASRTSLHPAAGGVPETVPTDPPTPEPKGASHRNGELINDTTTPGSAVELPFRKREEVEVVPAHRPSPGGWLRTKFGLWLGLMSVGVLLAATAFVFISATGTSRAHTMFSEAEEIFGRGNFTAALKHYRQFVEQFPEDDLVATAQQRIDIIQSRLDRQRQLVQTRQIQSLLTMAQQAFARKRLTVPPEDNVILHTNRILEIDPTHPGALELQAQVIKYYQDRAEIAAKRRQFRTARKYYSKVLEILPGHEETLARLQELGGKNTR